MTAAERSARTAEADALCARSYGECGGPDTGAALVAVGGYGRGDLAPCSDLDVVLVSDEGVVLEATGTVKSIDDDNGARIATVAITASVDGKAVLGRATARVRLPA